MSDNQLYENTDCEIWRERKGDYYSDSIHVTRQGEIGINCGGVVFVMPARSWHALAHRQVQRTEGGDVSDNPELKDGIELAHQVIAWGLFNGPGNLRSGEVREHIRALFGAEIDAALAAKLAKREEAT